MAHKKAFQFSNGVTFYYKEIAQYGPCFSFYRVNKIDGSVSVLPKTVEKNYKQQKIDWFGSITEQERKKVLCQKLQVQLQVDAEMAEAIYDFLP